MKIIRNITNEENEITDKKRIEIYLNENYEFKMDEISNRTLFRKKSSQEKLQILKNYEYNSIYRELVNRDHKIHMSELGYLLNSDFVKKYNPVVDYINKLEKWDGETDYIAQLANTVKTTDDAYFLWAFKKWFVAFVQCATKSDVINHTAFILTGAQGIGKTTWLMNLVPKSLSNYKFSGKVNPSNKDSTLLLAERILINMDELATFSKNQIEAFKELITKEVVSERKAYQRDTEDFVRRASFVGSANHDQILSDVTGNRRFLINEAVSIEYNHSVDLDKVYSQAKALAESDFRFYFNLEDIKRVESNNASYKQITSEEEYVDMYLELPTKENNDGMVRMNASEIIDLINLRSEGYINMKASNIGKLLKSKGFQTSKRDGLKKYEVLLK